MMGGDLIFIDVVTLFTFFIITFNIYLTFLLIRERYNTPKTFEEPYQEISQYEEDEKFVYFDERIKALREELNISSTEAEELHPLVKNIPHNSIDKAFYSLPDVEKPND